MRNVSYGWMIRYFHANGAAFFFIFIYIHMAKGLYYGSYKAPRIMLWSIGVIIFLLLIITGFLGYQIFNNYSLKWLNLFLEFYQINIQMSFFIPTILFSESQDSHLFLRIKNLIPRLPRMKNLTPRLPRMNNLIPRLPRKKN